MVGIGLLCAAFVYWENTWLTIGLVVVAIVIQQAGYPHSLGYSMRYKQIGQASHVFRFLNEPQFGRDDSVAIHSKNESIFFLACVNDYLLPRSGRMHYAERVEDAADTEWLIICAKDAFDLKDRVHGKQYRVSWDFLDEKMIPAGYNEMFKDDFYKVYHRNG